ncbi:epidermal retinol dehydrogenase 2-like [Pecten maximus]|uniref:epidermal retinol dehydrogenase 2-like n=1 Tax=Pecten maximus TaxID=6579 RepID=UPI0014591B6F|nr:epidermal retinol dehydrogenase 2-like [Pecten maximus]
MERKVARMDSTADDSFESETFLSIFKDLMTCMKHVIVALCVSVWRFFISPPRKCVKNDIVLITGSGSGIGRQLAEEFAKLGAILVLWDIEEKTNLETAELVQQAGAKCYCYTCDVGNRDDVYKTAKKVKQDVGDVTILVNNAGVVSGKKLIDIPDHQIEKTINVNLMAHFWTVKSFLPTMMRRNYGHVVTVGSSTGLVGLNKLTDYSTSKFGVVGFSEVLNYEVIYGGYDGVNTTLICPSFVNTGLFHGCKMKFPWLLPALETQKTVDRMMQAILTNQKMICIPRSVYFLATLKMILPVDAFIEVKKFFGAAAFMDTYVGRDKRFNSSRSGTNGTNGFHTD